MIQMLLVFLVILLILTFGIREFKSLTNSEKWEFTKLIFRGIILSAVAVAIVFLIVILF
jgi:hypothetical protein